MSNIVEMMNYAAKAANLLNNPEWVYDGHTVTFPVDWEPLEDDGDAMRLLMRCNLELVYNCTGNYGKGPLSIRVRQIKIDEYENSTKLLTSIDYVRTQVEFRCETELPFSDEYDNRPTKEAAIRKAIFLAAVEIGKLMP